MSATDAVVIEVGQDWTEEEIELFQKAAGGEATISDQEREEAERLAQDVLTRIRKEIERGKRYRDKYGWRG